MTAKSDELVEELVSACVAFGREKEPDWQTRIETARCALKAHIEELEAENAELKERVAMLDVTAVYKSLGEMGYIEQVDRLTARIAELELGLNNQTVHSNTLQKILTEKLDRIAELEAAQRWRVVADGELPEVGEEVFVCDESGHRRVDWLVCKPIDGVGETLFYSAAYDDDPPTHWMPLPKLPEVQE